MVSLVFKDIVLFKSSISFITLLILLISSELEEILLMLWLAESIHSPIYISACLITLSDCAEFSSIFDNLSTLSDRFSFNFSPKPSIPVFIAS